jgi:hypothetical protein
MDCGEGYGQSTGVEREGSHQVSIYCCKLAATKDLRSSVRMRYVHMYGCTALRVDRIHPLGSAVYVAVSTFSSSGGWDVLTEKSKSFVGSSSIKKFGLSANVRSSCSRRRSPPERSAIGCDQRDWWEVEGCGSIGERVWDEGARWGRACETRGHRVCEMEGAVDQYVRQ